jgi:hypothetical protein
MAETSQAPRRVMLKVSPQRQVTLTNVIWEAMLRPSHVIAEVVKGKLSLTPVFGTDIEEAARLYGKAGITAEVLAEAMRIVERRRAEKAAGGSA